jgi:hypothetical protein
MASTKDFAAVIRKKLDADPELAAAVEHEQHEAAVQQLRFDLQSAYQQLAYLWETTHSCPCGARKESPNTHPHVMGCPTAVAVRQDEPTPTRESVPLDPRTVEKVSKILKDRGFPGY